jgi:GAF domain-containing protein
MERLFMDNKGRVQSNFLREEKRFFTDTQGRTVAAIQKQRRKQAVRQVACRGLQRIGCAVATAALVFYLGLTAAAATVQSAGVNLIKMLNNIEEQYTENRYPSDEGLSFKVPAEWKGNFYMSYIPDGYSLAGWSNASGNGQEVVYVNPEGGVLRFSESTRQAEVDLSIKGFLVKPVRINGASGTLAKTASEVVVAWSASDRYFALSVSGRSGDALQIAERVMQIKND